jgi:ribose transport system permease protein
VSSHDVAEPIAAPAQRSTRPAKGRAAEIIAQFGTIIGLILMAVVFSIMASGTFPKWDNFVNILNQASLTAIIAGGLTVVLIVGEFDLSIGYMASYAGVLVTGLMVTNGLPVWLAIVLVVLAGAVYGFVNGILVTKLRVNAVIATIGSGTILVGLTYAYTNGNPITAGVPDSFLNIAVGKFGSIPHDVVIMAAILAVLWILINRTDVGQRIQAVGGNIEASRLSGIRVDRIKILAFVISGACAALTGILLASLIGSGQSDAGNSYLMSSFAAVFLGAATLRDGEFHILGTFVGVLVIGVGLNGLALVGAPTFYQFILQGGFLIVAVALSTIARMVQRR